MPLSPRTTAHLLAAVLACAAAPAAAHAAGAAPPPHVPVPAGQLQHTVTELSWPAAGNTFQHHTLRNERWITATAGRELVTDTVTGKVLEDCAYGLVVTRCYEVPIGIDKPLPGQIDIFPGSSALLQSWDDV